MKLNFPGISQTDFAYAFECLAVCQKPDARAFGFDHPYFMPGGMYGAQWWQLDSSLALGGYKWKDRAFSETALLNFIGAQKEDGRIPLWGKDSIPEKVAGGDILQQTDGNSSLPKLFDIAYHILRGTTDTAFKAAVYEMLAKYLSWWFSARQDAKTGLITAVFEETFIPYLGKAGEYAPVDTNVEIYAACHYMEALSEELGKPSEAARYKEQKKALRESINRWLWSEEKGAYYPYSIKEGRHTELLMASTFFPLRFAIAPKDRQEKLIALLTNHDHFNWKTFPLTSVSRKDPAFRTTRGAYVGNASWSGNVWTLINEMVIRGLCDVGEKELAAELCIKTVRAFNHNCAEFIHPEDGSGHGVLQYAWSASQYISLITEVLFGISYDAAAEELSVSPCLPAEMKESTLSLSHVEIARGVFLDVHIEGDKVSYTVS